jgi:L-threonylcarbamoyladenylate synthase
MGRILTCSDQAIKSAARSLIEGNLVAFPTETVYGLGADATNKKAIARIYSAKGRPLNHPLIVHISSISQLSKWAIIKHQSPLSVECTWRS